MTYRHRNIAAEAQVAIKEKVMKPFISASKVTLHTSKKYLLGQEERERKNS